MSDQLNVSNAQKSDMEEKLQQLYSTLRERSKDKGSIDELFGKYTSSVFVLM